MGAATVRGGAAGVGGGGAGGSVDGLVLAGFGGDVGRGLVWLDKKTGQY